MTLDLNKKLRRFRFTWNNYEETTIDRLTSMTKKECEYCTFGFEIAPTTGTPHLQGYIEFRYPITGIACKKKLDPVNGLKSPVCILACNASREANIAYAQKTETKDPNRETPFIELNFRESTQGTRTDWHEMREFLEETPDFGEFAKEYPEQAFKYHAGVDRIINACKEAKQVQEFKDRFPEDSVLYTWQRTLSNRLRGKADDRKIIWFYDEKGNQGKSWISRYLVANQNAVRFTNAASKDIAHAYNGEPIAIMDFSRTNEDRINYTILENLKDGMVFSPKYNSRCKHFASPWVVVMANFLPNMSSCSQDRWEIHTLTGNPIKEDAFHDIVLDISHEQEDNILSKENVTACNIESAKPDHAVTDLPKKFILPLERIEKAFELQKGEKITKKERRKLKRELKRSQTPPSSLSSSDL